MKRIGTALTIVFIIAGFAISFFIGHYVSDKSHTESRAAQFDKYISRAIDTIKDKGLSIDGAPEAIASNIWVDTNFVIALKFPQNSAICGIPLYMKKMCFSVKKMC